MPICGLWIDGELLYLLVNLPDCLWEPIRHYRISSHSNRSILCVLRIYNNCGDVLEFVGKTEVEFVSSRKHRDGIGLIRLVAVGVHNCCVIHLAHHMYLAGGGTEIETDIRSIVKGSEARNRCTGCW